MTLSPGGAHTLPLGVADAVAGGLPASKAGAL